MKLIYETPRYAGRTNVDYEDLKKLADKLREDEPMSDVPAISYARVSTPQQRGTHSLSAQHDYNVRRIREHFDNDIVFVTEVGSGGAEPKDRILYRALLEAPLHAALYCLNYNRLFRSCTNILPIFELLYSKSICVSFHFDSQKKGNSILVVSEDDVSILREYPHDSLTACVYFADKLANSSNIICD